MGNQNIWIVHLHDVMELSLFYQEGHERLKTHLKFSESFGDLVKKNHAKKV